MKYTGGRSYFNKVTQEWKSFPRVYTNFYCSLSEWFNLGRGKENFMYQVRSHIVDLYGYPEDKRTELEKCKVKRDEFKFKLKNGLTLNKLSFDRGGRRDSLEGEKYSAWIISEAIKLITNRECKVEFYSWKGTIDHIEINFPGASVPNIICLIDDYCCSSTNKTLIFIIDCIYKTLGHKLTVWYDRYLYKFYNENYDIVYLKPDSEHSSGEYVGWQRKSQWKDIIKPKANRIITNKTNISYK